MKILITGGAGYIGSVLVPAMLQNGHAVTVLDNFMYHQDSLLGVCYHPHLIVIDGDVRNKAMFKKEISKHDLIIPLAAIVGAPACNRDPELATQINLEQILSLAKLVGRNQRVLFPMTNSGYGVGQNGIYCDETTPLNPISHYGRTKVGAEKILLEQCSAVTFRLSTVFGASPRMRLDLLINDFVYRAYKDRFIVLFESQFKRNFIHIRDISRVFLHAIDHFDSMIGEAYNVGLSQSNLSKLELCEKIKLQVPDFHIFKSDLAEDPDKRDYIVSNEKIEATGWRPSFSLDEGIRELIKVYRFLSVKQYINLLP